MRNPNGYGTVIKLSGNRRKPFACRKTVGFSENGYPIYKYISYHKTRREAVQALAEFNKNPYDIAKIKFSDAFEKWIEYKNPKPEMEKKYRNAFRHCAPLHDKYMTDLTLKELQYFSDSVVTTKHILHHITIMLTAVFDYCIKHGLIPVSSKETLKLVEWIPRQEVNAVKRSIFTRDEIDWLWKHRKEKIVQFTLFYIYTGLRFSELHNISKDEIKKKYISVKQAKTLAGIRDVPMSDKALSLLPLPDMPKYGIFYLEYKDMCARLGSMHTPHDTRHTFISLMTEAGTDPRILKKIVGHAADNVTEDVYTHISMDAMLEAVNRI